MTRCVSVLAAMLAICAGCGPSGGGNVQELTSSRPAEKGAAAEKQEAGVASSQPAGGGVHKFVVKNIEDQDQPLAAYKGKVLLIVNVASKCGYTPQYTGLEKVYEKYRDKGLVVLGFPSNDFGAQEPGTHEQIKEFCSTKYKVTFPLMAKSSVKNGPGQSDFYQYLSSRDKNGAVDAKVAWNFNKFLVSRDGQVLKHYPSKVAPESDELIGDIEAALKK